MTRSLAVTVFFALTLGAGGSRISLAALITSASGVPQSAKTVDFSQFYATGQVIVTKNSSIPIGQFADETVLLKTTPDSADAYLLGQHGVVYPDNNFYLGTNGR